MAAMLVPVGHSVGPLFPVSGERDPDSYEIRFGDGIFSIDEEEMRIWALAHGDPHRVAVEVPSRKMIFDTAGDMSITTINQVIDRLRDVGLLVEFEPGSPQARGFAHRHQVFPLALGLGNSAETPWYFEVGLPNAPRVIVSTDVYHLWMFANRHPSLWDACQYLAVEHRETTASDLPIEVNPDQIMAHFLEALPAMLATACVYVDRVR